MSERDECGADGAFTCIGSGWGEWCQECGAERRHDDDEEAGK